MLRLYNYDIKKIDLMWHRHFAGVLNEASQIEVKQQVNGDYILSFEYPRNGEFAKEINSRFNYAVECEGQFFRLKKVSRSGTPMMRLECEHVFNYLAKRTHIQNIASTDSGDFIGEDAYKVLNAAVAMSGGRFSLLSDEELSELGMSRIKVDIDFESMDKTNLYDVMLKIIECAGIGEIYADNYRIAIVNRIGRDSNVVLDTARNMTNITIERDISEIVTRLYVYGKDNLEITNATKNTDGTPYVENFGNSGVNTAGQYGIIDGYRDYSDCADADRLLERALWELDPLNPDRLDVPSVNISGSVADLSRLGEDVDSLRLGDTVRVIDDGEAFTERVISITRYPFEPIADNVSIGRVKKDAFYYLNRLGMLAKRYSEVSTNDGRILGTKLTGFAIKNGELYFNGKRIVTEEV